MALTLITFYNTRPARGRVDTRKRGLGGKLRVLKNNSGNGNEVGEDQKSSVEFVQILKICTVKVTAIY